MYAMEYTKQENAAPAAITIVVHLALVYVFAAGMGVVPSPLPKEPLQWVAIPTEELVPKPIEKKQQELPGTVPDLEHAVPNVPPTIVVEKIPIQTGEGETRIETGGGPAVIEAVVTNARIKYSPEPPYPLVSRAREEEGTVFVKVMISPYGTAGDVQIEKSSGFPRLDEAALKAVRGWRFTPATRDSQAIAAWVTVSVQFVLNNRS